MISIQTKSAQKFLTLGGTMLLIIILLGLMVTIAKQQGTINRNALIREQQDTVIQEQLQAIADASKTHDEFINFISAGKRFTFEDGQALFYLINNCSNELTHKGLFDVYGEKSTPYKQWLFEQRQCIK